MPKNIINYDNTIIYKICCNDPTITDIYIGHTTNFIKRKQQHKSSCSNPTTKKYNYYKYEFIRKNGGWLNWNMIEIIKIKCVDVYDACRVERQYIEQLKATLNKYKPIITENERIEYLIEYNEQHKEKIKKHKKEYREKTKDKIKEYTENNKDKLKEYKKLYREQNKDKIKEYFEQNKDKLKEYREQNKEKRKEYFKEYRKQNKIKIKQHLDAIEAIKINNNY